MAGGVTPRALWTLGGALTVVTEPVTGGRFEIAGQLEGVLRDSEPLVQAPCA